MDTTYIKGQGLGINELSIFNQLNKPSSYLQGGEISKTPPPNLSKERREQVYSSLNKDNEYPKHSENNHL